MSIQIKSQKVASSYSNKIYLFRFKEKKLCPVRSIQKLHKYLRNHKLFDKNLPVFRFGQTKFLTQKVINNFLKKWFPDSHISGHSFRAGIPTSIANFPDLTNDNHAMGWGRWRSKAFSSYQKAKKKQKNGFFIKLKMHFFLPKSS